MHHKRDRITESLINLYGLIKAFSIKEKLLKGYLRPIEIFLACIGYMFKKCNFF